MPFKLNSKGDGWIQLEAAHWMDQKGMRLRVALSVTVAVFLMHRIVLLLPQLEATRTRDVAEPAAVLLLHLTLYASATQDDFTWSLVEQYCGVCFEMGAVCSLWFKGGGEAPKKGLTPVSLVLLLSGSTLHGAWTAWRDPNAGGAMTLPVGAAVDVFVGIGEAIGGTALLWATTRPVERSARTILQGASVCFCGFVSASVVALISSMAIGLRPMPGTGGRAGVNGYTVLKRWVGRATRL